jgi:hypothetical protein
MDAELRARIEQYVHRAVRPRNIDTGAICQSKHARPTGGLITPS